MIDSDRRALDSAQFGTDHLPHDRERERRRRGLAARVRRGDDQRVPTGPQLLPAAQAALEVNLVDTGVTGEVKRPAGDRAVAARLALVAASLGDALALHLPSRHLLREGEADRGGGV